MYKRQVEAYVNYSSFNKFSRIFEFADSENDNNVQVRIRALLFSRFYARICTYFRLSVTIPAQLCNLDVTGKSNFGICSDTATWTSLYSPSWHFWETSTWLHVVVSVNETGFMKMYRNGNLSSSSQGQVPNSVTRNYHYIGKSTYSGWSNFHGTIG